MSCNKKRMTAALLALFFALSIAGCTQAKTGNTTSENLSSIGGTITAAEEVSGDEMFSEQDKEIGYDESTAVSITLSDSGIQSSSDGVRIVENTATITSEGTYILSGSMTNGQIVVEAEKTDKLQLVLDGVQLNCNTSAAIYVKQADKVFLTLASGSQNSLSNQSEFVAIDDNSIDSVLFSKEDLTLNGTGALTINTAYGHGIVSKDDLVITGGTYRITAAGHALSGKDSVRIADGSFTLSSGKDGIQAENTEDTSLGYLYIFSGSFEITSAGDGLDASSFLQIESGTFQIDAGGGSQNAVAGQETMTRPGAQEQQSTTTETDTVSTKGIKATGNLILNGGDITIDAADDGLHSNASLAIKDGNILLSTGDDGVHADANVTISGSTLAIIKSYEGIEGQSIDLTGGEISVTSSDDGLNAAGGNDQSGFGGGMGRDGFAADENSYIKISGGTINVNASGDGIDSNGSLTVSGGETYVSGPTNSGNGALDYAGDAQITGGIFVAVGQSGMAQNFGESSTQGVILTNISPDQAAAELVLKDSLGNSILSYTPEKSYYSVVISCPEIKQGESYTLEAGTQSVTIEMTSIVYGFGGGMSGGPGGGAGGGRPSGDMGKLPREDMQ